MFTKAVSSANEDVYVSGYLHTIYRHSSRILPSRTPADIFRREGITSVDRSYEIFISATLYQQQIMTKRKLK